jgi:hypothetical protein
MPKKWHGKPSRRKILKAMSTTGVAAAAGSFPAAASSGDDKKIDVDFEELTGSERQKLISEVLSDERTRKIRPEIAKSGWKINLEDGNYYRVFPSDYPEYRFAVIGFEPKQGTKEGQAVLFWTDLDTSSLDMEVDLEQVAAIIAVNPDITAKPQMNSSQDGLSQQELQNRYNTHYHVENGELVSKTEPDWMAEKPVNKTKTADSASVDTAPSVSIQSSDWDVTCPPTYYQPCFSCWHIEANCTSIDYSCALSWMAMAIADASSAAACAACLGTAGWLKPACLFCLGYLYAESSDDILNELTCNVHSNCDPECVCADEYQYEFRYCG